ncbi:uncharacterized protein LOC108088577 [Drosophila ficusphila]|uniref:uncharacterized protein LOC108088577 n=1 Tax=Drosophila ficusphila TaxID=30025 RepID=UPI0007E62016|nr:uncharacterized protein LOC108088577 [Drosophila ficusphila]
MMEEKRLERQKRLLAMRSAAPSLPSTQRQEFTLRLVELYKERPCLWKTSSSEYKDVELKQIAWEEIAGQLGSHLSAEFVRSQMRRMRYHLNVYKLQMLEYQITPGVEKPPEKPFYIDSFAFLDSTADLETPESNRETESETSSTAERYAKFWSSFRQKSLAKFEANDGSSEDHHRSETSIFGMVKKRMAEAQMKPLNFTMPRLSISQIQKDIIRNRVLERKASATSFEVLSETPPLLKARPGDSVSKTKLDPKQLSRNRRGEQPTTSKMAQLSLGEVQSEDEDLYNMHWNVRKEQRSLRPGQDYRPKLPTRHRSSRTNEPSPDIF